MEQAKLVMARQLPAPFVEYLSSLGEVRSFDPDYPTSALIDASVWVGTAMDPVPAALIDTFPESLGLIGLGEIGQAVARRARGFDIKVIYHGPRRKPEAEDSCGAEYREALSALLAEVDILSLNCPLTEATHHLIDADALAQMKSGAILVNTGRGPLVDEAALVSALESGQLGGAGLDVFEFEPEVTPALEELTNVVLLPHIGSATAECRGDMAARALANIKTFLESGKPLDRCTDRES